MEADKYTTIFEALRAILQPYAAQMDVKADTGEHYYLDTFKNHPLTNKPAFFGAAQIRKNYVSYYLMPVYLYPVLLEGISEGLKKRMQGKSCFNFKSQDAALFAELKELTERGYKKYDEQGLI